VTAKIRLLFTWYRRLPVFLTRLTPGFKTTIMHLGTWDPPGLATLKQQTTQSGQACAVRRGQQYACQTGYSPTGTMRLHGSLALLFLRASAAKRALS
jgi:hypothetical protein